MGNLQTRTSWVDYAKAIGIILVVYGHVARGLFNAGIDVPITFYQLTDSIIYSFHMPLFFFLSGLFFYSSFSKKGPAKLINSKIDTIVYPYILWSIFQGSIESFLATYTNGTVTINEVLALLWSPRAQFWFLYALFICFLFITIIYTFTNKKITLFLLVIATSLYLHAHFLPDFLSSNLQFTFLKRNLIFFVLGITFALYLKIQWFDNIYAVSILGLSFVGLQYLFHIVYDLSFVDHGYFLLLVSIVSILFIVSLCAWISKRENKLLIQVGYASMAIYLMHILAGSGVRVVLKSILNIDNFIAHLILGLIAAILFPMIALSICNKYQVPYVFSAPISNLWQTNTLIKNKA